MSKWINPLKSFKYSLLYRASRDGDTTQAFHNMCDNKGPTITLILTTEGWIFGGYSDIPWNTESYSFEWEYKESKEVFLFSINLQKKYPIKNPNYAIFCRGNQGPTFGIGPDINIRNNSLSEKSYCQTPSTFGPMETKNEINGNKMDFIAKEIEIYLVEENGNR